MPLTVSNAVAGNGMSTRSDVPSLMRSVPPLTVATIAATATCSLFVSNNDICALSWGFKCAARWRANMSTLTADRVAGLGYLFSERAEGCPERRDRVAGLGNFLRKRCRGSVERDICVKHQTSDRWSIPSLIVHWITDVEICRICTGNCVDYRFGVLCLKCVLGRSHVVSKFKPRQCPHVFTQPQADPLHLSTVAINQPIAHSVQICEVCISSSNSLGLSLYPYPFSQLD